jgi:hypothetical protein
MRRGGVVPLLVVSGLALAGLVATAAGDRRDLAFTIGVVPSIAAATLAPGDEVCQAPVSVSESFSRVGLTTGAPGGAGQPLAVSVRAADGGRVLGEGEIPGRFPDRADLTTAVGSVQSGQRVSVCVRNIGERRAIVYGNAGAAALPSAAEQDGRPLPTDLTLRFLEDSERSPLSELPELFDRASVFRPGWVGSWTFLLLAAAALIGVPLLLARALADTEAERAASEAAPAERPAPAR